LNCGGKSSCTTFLAGPAAPSISRDREDVFAENKEGGYEEEMNLEEVSCYFFPQTKFLQTLTSSKSSPLIAAAISVFG
jgi:hypothetical protein